VSESSSLVNRHDQDTRYIVETARPFFLGKIPHEVAAEFVVLGHDVEEERLDVVVECFGAEEEFGH